jgi:transcription termination factor Rho
MGTRDRHHPLRHPQGRAAHAARRAQENVRAPPHPQSDWPPSIFALLKVNTINFEDPEKARHKINFDSLTPLYPDQRLRMEDEDPTKKDLSPRV